jgi:murein endopeptidase
MLEVQPKDSRGYFMLPQAPEEAGYYVYGSPEQGAGQYAHPATLTLLFFVERDWQAVDSRKFGVGNISLAGGSEFKPHHSHMDGLQVDVRPYERMAPLSLLNIFRPAMTKRPRRGLSAYFKLIQQ